MTSADVIAMVCFCHPLMGQVFFLLHVLLIQLGLLLIFQWHTWTFTRRHKQMCSDTMWPSYTTESSLLISGTDTTVLLSRDFIAVWVYGVYLSVGTRCTSSDWRSTAVHPAVWWRRLGPQWNKPAQQKAGGTAHTFISCSSNRGKTEEDNNVFPHPSADPWIYQIPPGA